MKKNHDSTTIANFFDLWTSDEKYPHYTMSEYLRVLKTVPALIEPGKKVLDVGCGVGFVAQALKRQGHTVIGLDLSSAALNEALTNKSIDSAVCSGIEDTRLESESVDVVVCWGVLMLVFDLEKAFKEIARILKPQGTIVVVDHYDGNPYTKLHFSRPNWVDIFIEGKKNIDRRALTPQLIRSVKPELFAFNKPYFHSMFTFHPNKLINAVHSVARLTFDGIRLITKAPWTGNFMSLSGIKK